MTSLSSNVFEFLHFGSGKHWRLYFQMRSLSSNVFVSWHFGSGKHWRLYFLMTSISSNVFEFLHFVSGNQWRLYFQISLYSNVFELLHLIQENYGGSIFWWRVFPLMRRSWCSWCGVILKSPVLWFGVCKSCSSKHYTCFNTVRTREH